MSDTSIQGQPNGKPPSMPAPPPYKGLPYGENKQLQDVAAGTPAAVPTGPDAVLAQATSAAQPAPSLFSPSARPHEPITAGLPMGPGPGPEAIGMDPRPRITKILDLLAATSGNPAIASLAAEAASRNL